MIKYVTIKISQYFSTTAGGNLMNPFTVEDKEDALPLYASIYGNSEYILNKITVKKDIVMIKVLFKVYSIPLDQRS